MPAAGKHGRSRAADVYTVGLVMYRGQAATNTRVAYDVQLPHRAGRVKSVLSTPRRQFVFVDLLGASPTPGSAWASGRTVTKAWGCTEYPLTPRASFDALLFIDAVRAPEYLPPTVPNPAP